MIFKFKAHRLNDKGIEHLRTELNKALKAKYIKLLQKDKYDIHGWIADVELTATDPNMQPEVFFEVEDFWCKGNAPFIINFISAEHFIFEQRRVIKIRYKK